MKKFIKLTLACLLTLGFVATQGNTAQAARMPYNNSRGHLINGYWDTRASINLKLRHNYWFYSKWQHEMKFRIGGGGAVKMDEEYGNYDPNKFQQMTGAWDFDDDYDILVRDTYNNVRLSTRLQGGTDVAAGMKRLKREFNNANIETGYTFRISSYWNDTITPNNGGSKNLYLAKEGRRTSYNFTFTDEGLVEEATNLRGTDNINTVFLLPIKEKMYNGYERTYNAKLEMNITGYQNARFSHEYIPTLSSMAGNLDINVLYKGTWSGFRYPGQDHYNARSGFDRMAEYLNNFGASYGDYIKFDIRSYDKTPRMGLNYNNSSSGLYDLTRDTGRLKLTRYGFLTDSGYKLNYRGNA